MSCRAWWTPILFTTMGTEIAWLCEQCQAIHQRHSNDPHCFIETRSLA